ncbi:MAG TPA: hypothetical protein VF690_21000, partial [Hymenobacter sp.]
GSFYTTAGSDYRLFTDYHGLAAGNWADSRSHRERCSRLAYWRGDSLSLHGALVRFFCGPTALEQ